MNNRMVFSEIMTISVKTSNGKRYHGFETVRACNGHARTQVMPPCLARFRFVCWLENVKNSTGSDFGFENTVEFYHRHNPVAGCAGLHRSVPIFSPSDPVSYEKFNVRSIRPLRTASSDVDDRFYPGPVTGVSFSPEMECFFPFGVRHANGEITRQQIDAWLPSDG
jgi:hypothetical protein